MKYEIKIVKFNKMLTIIIHWVSYSLPTKLASQEIFWQFGLLFHFCFILLFPQNVLQVFCENEQFFVEGNIKYTLQEYNIFCGNKI